MIKIYAVIVLVALLGGVGYAAKSYYTSTQQKIQTLSENNAKLEVAIEQSEKSVNLLKSEAAKNAELNKNLQEKLQKAEAYGDNLRNRLRKLDLLADAISNAKNLEGRMNGATAKLWRELMEETGNNTGGTSDLPFWLQPNNAGTGSEGSDTSTKSDSTDSSKTKTD
jgi:outer membrane murein-binding lipoprotein Lpp